MAKQTTPTKTKWQLALHEAERLQSQGITLLYERIVKLVEVYDDPNFHAWCDDTSTDMFDYLDGRLSDVNGTFMTFREVYYKHPNKADWVAGNLRKMIAQVIDDGKADKKPDRDPPTNWKKLYMEMKSENATLKARVQAMEDTIKMLHGETQPV